MPALNEENTISSVIHSVENMYPEFDIAVIDDGSTDNTAALSQQTSATVIRHPFHQGYGTAIQTGYKFALSQNYSYVVQMDCDGQHDPASIKPLLSAVVTDSADIALGSRFLSDSKYPISFNRLAGIMYFRFIVRLLTGQTITDPTTGFQAMNRRVLRHFSQDIFPCDYPDADVMVFLFLLRLRHKEVPVKMHPNITGKSMHSGIITSTYYIFKLTMSAVLTRFRSVPP